MINKLYSIVIVFALFTCVPTTSSLAHQQVAVVPLNTGSKAIGDAEMGDVLEDKTFSNSSATGVSGTMANVGAQDITPSTSAQTITAGYHNGSGEVAGDSDLTAENIKSGATIFGVTGTIYTPVQKTGQTISYATGDDGDLTKGVARPIPRFTDNNNGTVRDNLTGLVWLKNANCFNRSNWDTALTDANTLASGTCSLSDGSSAGDWRLPNRKELESLLSLQYSGPALSNAAGTAKWSEGDAFSGLQVSYYWSSTTSAFDADKAWRVNLHSGSATSDIAACAGDPSKASIYYVWPVRD